MFRFSDIIEIQGENKTVTEKGIFNRTEMNESINNTETGYGLVEVPLSMHRSVSNETTLISEIPNIVTEENVIIAPGQKQTKKKNKTVPILFEEFVKSKHFLIFFLRLNLVMHQHHLRPSTNFAMHKIKPDNLTAGIVKINFKETVKNFVASDNAFSFMSSVKRIPTYWKQFLYNVLKN